MGIEGIEHLKNLGDAISLGPDCLLSGDGNLISYKGENFYKSCSVKVKEFEGSTSYCVKRVGHPGLLHEDFFGNVSTGIED